ncbi:hypothetical protein ABW19_dt0200298 [Dactylella cylindrospora]|nr:hypothetical protein ABW19_dt0200298 [Dactylella cylindrospora]
MQTQELMLNPRHGIGGRTKTILSVVLSQTRGKTNRIAKSQNSNIKHGLRAYRRANNREEPDKDKEVDNEEGEEEDDTGRQMIGGLSYIGVEPNLCYMNTGIQSLAATGFVEWLKSSPAIGIDEDDTSNTLNDVFDCINRYFTENSKASDRVTVTPNRNEVHVDDVFDESGQQQSAVELITHLNRNVIADRGGDEGLRRVISRALNDQDSLSEEQEEELKARIAIIDSALTSDNYDDDDMRERLGIKRSQISYDSAWTDHRMIEKLPQILILEFANVARMDNTGMPLNKLLTKVRYSPTLDLNDFIVGPNVNMTRPLRSLRIPDDPANPQVPLYELRAVLIHAGKTMVGGHWYCVRREWKGSPDGEQWWLCDDSETYRVRREWVFGEQEDPKCNGTMYALIYERLPEGEDIPGIKEEVIDEKDIDDSQFEKLFRVLKGVEPKKTKETKPKAPPKKVTKRRKSKRLTRRKKSKK